MACIPPQKAQIFLNQTEYEVTESQMDGKYTSGMHL